MPLSEQAARFLLSPPGRTLIQYAETLLADGVDALPALTRLRKVATPELCAAAWELAVLRLRAAAKFGPDAAHLFFTRESMEQASGLRASAYHAACFLALEVSHVNDLCGGVGGDALAFARAGLSVTLYEYDLVRALFAQANAEVCQLSHRIDVQCEDVTQAALTPGAVWFDPARREGGKRIPRPDDYLPSLSCVHGWASGGASPIGVKLSPAIDHALAAEYGADLEFVSDGGECKEALLWQSGASFDPNGVRAVLLSDTAPHVLEGPADFAAPLESNMHAAYLYEPDPAVIRAHLVGTLAPLLGASSVDPSIAYLVSDTLVPTLFARAYEVLERFVYTRRALQEALTRRGVGHVVVKKRGFPLEPDAVRKQLKLSGPETITVVLTRKGDRHVVFLCRPVVAPGV